MQTPFRVHFHGRDLAVSFETYLEGKGVAIELSDPETGEPWARATMNVPGHVVQPNEIVIRDYNENEGVFNALVEAGLIEPEYTAIPAGFVEGKATRLSHKAIQWRDSQAETMPDEAGNPRAKAGKAPDINA